MTLKGPSREIWESQLSSGTALWRVFFFLCFLKDMGFDVPAMVLPPLEIIARVAAICDSRDCRMDVGFKVKVLADPAPSHWLQSPPGRRAIIQLAQHN